MAKTNTPYKLIRNTKENISAKPIEDGNIYFSTDTEEILMDDGDKRKNFSNNTKIQAIQDEIIKLHPTTNTWTQLKTNITLGRKKELYPIGKQFEDAHKKFTNVKWEVIDYDHIKAQDGLNKSNICLQTVNAYNGYQFDRPEFLYFVKEAEGLKAGIYNFFATKPYEENESRPCGGNKTYNFTLSKPIPQNGGITIDWGWGKLISSGKIKTYKDSLCRTEDLIETVSIIEGENGTPLAVGEQTDGKGRLNQIDRIHFGSNNFAQSGIVQWLNGIGLNWWKKQTEWDTAPTYVTQEGFLGGFPQDFIDNITPVTMTVATNTIYETNSLDGTEFKTNSSYNYTCKIFPLSMTEYGWGNNNNVAEGVAVDKYREASNADKIKYDTSKTARYVWMRSPNPWLADSVRGVYVDGSLSTTSAYIGFAVAPACIIQSK